MPLNPNAVEQEHKRTYNAKHFQNPDGTYVAEVSTGSKHYWDASGGVFKDKVLSFRVGSGAKGPQHFISDESDVVMETYGRGSGGSRRWVVEFTERLTGNGIRFILGTQPNPALGTPNLPYPDTTGREWTYTHTPSGGKLRGPVTATRQGPRTYSFPYEIVGSSPALVTNADGSISSGNVFRLARPVVDGANGMQYPASEWTIAGGTVSFAFDDTVLPASALPYRVDPTSTFGVTASANDTSGRPNSSGTYPPVFNTINEFANNSQWYVTRSINAGLFYIGNCFAKWDTGAALADSVTVTGGTLRVYPYQLFGDADGSSITFDWYQWPTPLTASDLTQTPGTNAHSGTPIGNFSLNTTNDLALANVAANISKTAMTYIRGHVSPDQQPTGVNELALASYDNAELEPTLLVDYTENVQRLTPSSIVSQSGFSPVLVLSNLQVDPDA